MNLVFNNRTTAERAKLFPEDPELPRLTECIERTLQLLNEDKKRRVMKTHFPFELLPNDIMKKGSKVSTSTLLRIICISLFSISAFNMFLLPVIFVCNEFLLQVIYVCRQPKDVAVSYYHYEKGSWHLDYTGDFKRYWDHFKNGECKISDL